MTPSPARGGPPPGPASPPQGSPDRAVPRRARKVLSTEELLEGAKEIGIVHGGQEYRLQVTRNGKLILTK